MYTIPIQAAVWRRRCAVHGEQVHRQQRGRCCAPWQSSLSCTETSDEKSALCPGLNCSLRLRSRTRSTLPVHPQLPKTHSSDNFVCLRWWKVEAEDPTTSVHRAKFVVAPCCRYHPSGSGSKPVCKCCWRLDA